MSDLVLKDPSLLRNACYINGEWRGAASGKTIAVTNPATGQIITHVPSMSGEETRAAIEAANEALKPWAAKTGKERAAILRRWYELMMANQEDLAQIMT